MNKIKAVGSLAPKSVFSYGGVDWIVLNGALDKVLCIADKVVFDRTFTTIDTTPGNDYNNWAKCELREYLNHEFLWDLLLRGADKSEFIPIKTNLTSDDGLKEYGICDDIISLISCSQYRIYREIITNAGASHLWWTCTPTSTKSNGYYYNCQCIYPDGSIGSHGAIGKHGVRPLCQLHAETIVTLIE